MQLHKAMQRSTETAQPSPGKDPKPFVAFLALRSAVHVPWYSTLPSEKGFLDFPSTVEELYRVHPNRQPKHVCIRALLRGPKRKAR